MSVRKRRWTTAKGEEKEAWVVNYTDAKGIRHLKTFKRKKDADEHEAQVKVDVRKGVHVPERESVTVGKASELWLSALEDDDEPLEQTTIAQYRQHLKFHILDHLGTTKLSALSVGRVRAFRDQLRDEELEPRGRRKTKRSPAMIRKAMSTLGSILAFAQEHELTTHNPVRELPVRRKRGAGARHKEKLEVGKHIPKPTEIRSIVEALDGFHRPLLLTAIFTGLRASELRGLRWDDVDFSGRRVIVRQRADRFNKIGSPKSKTSRREVPLTPIVINALREWKLKCPKRDTGKVDGQGTPVKVLDLVFPNGKGNVESHANIINRGFHPTQIAAGVSVETDKVDENGKPILAARYSGLHALRHFYASWCINRREDGGLGLPPKVVQERLGHSSIVMTMDIYGHLFPRGDDSEELAEAERALLA